MDPSTEYKKYMTKDVEGREGEGSIHNPAPKLGSGARFKAVEESARKSGAENPAAVAAAVGIKKYGKKKMAKMAAEGRKRANG